jgi:hypothetical protein
MLTRTGVGEYEAPVPSKSRIVARSRDNNNTNGATYRYNQAPLTSQVFDTLPGCEVDIVAGKKVFKGQVAFDTAAGATAAYDLFELDAAGQPVPLGETVLLSNGPGGLFMFNITGKGVSLADAPRPRRKARGMTARRKPSRKKASRKPRKPARRRTASKAKPRRSKARKTRRKGSR